MRKSSSRFGRLVACGAIGIGLAAVQALLASQAEAVPGLQRITKTSVSNSSTSRTVAANCPAGKRVLGGGGTVTGGRGQVVLERLEPVQTATNDRFVVGAREDRTGYSSNWQLTAYALCANPLPAYGILPSTSGSPSSNSPQSTISFCVGQPEVGFGGRINGGAGQVHLTNLVARLQRLRGLHFDRRAGGFQRLFRRLDCDRLRRLRHPQHPGQPHHGVRHHPGELGEQVRHSQLPRGHPGPQRRWSGADARGLRHGSIAGSSSTSVAIDPQLGSVTVRAVEDETGTAANWSVRALALCGP